MLCNVNAVLAFISGVAVDWLICPAMQHECKT